MSASRKARKSLLELLSSTNVLPRFLFITDVTTKDITSIAGIFRVGEHKGKRVALQPVSKCHGKDVSITSICISQY